MTTTYVELLRNRALSHPDKLAFTFLLDGEKKRVSLTYAELDQKARTIATHLQSLGAKGERALLLHPPGLEFVTSFFGCLYAGVVAVPAYPPRRNRPDSRIVSMVEDGAIAFALVSNTFSGLMEKSVEHIPVLKNLHMIFPEALPSPLSEQWTDPEILPETLAFLQYTSGSTAVPKGVMVSHQNLLYNEKMMTTAFGLTEDEVHVCWLPLYHDMGLIGNVLLSVYGGGHSVLMSPMSFLEKPLRWLQAVSDYKGTMVTAPNFAYDLCARKITNEEKVGLDLGHLKVAVNGAEPVRAKTFEHFTQVFAQAGFQSTAFQACYGLAEGTLFVTGGDRNSSPKVTSFDKDQLEQHQGVEAVQGSDQSIELVGHGSFDFGQKTRIVHQETLEPCADGSVGEIWVSGPSMTQGYWQRPEETAHTFQAQIQDCDEGPFVRTGDLGFFHKGELHITGRIKDLIIVRGKNHYPQDIEHAAELSHPDLHLGCCAAFSLEGGAEEQLAVVIEAKNRVDLESDAIYRAIRQAVSEQFDLTVQTIVLIKRGTLLKTSSGKVQRRATKQALLSGKLRTISNNTLPSEANEPSLESQDKKNLPQFLHVLMADILKLPQSQISLERPLTQYGLNSMMVIQSQHRLDEQLGVQLPLSLFFEGASIEKLATFVQKLLEKNPNRQLALPPIKRETEQQYETFPLTDIQQAYLIGRQGGLELGNIGTHLYREFPFKQLDVAVLQKVWNRLIQRHGMLRMVANHDGTQRVLSTVPEYQIKTRYLSDHASEDIQTHLQNVREQMSHQVFSGTQWPSFELRVSQCADSSYVLHMGIDILGLDASSLMLVFQELVTLYDNPEDALPELNITFRDYVLAEEKLREMEIYQTSQTYWYNRAADFPMAPELPFAKDPSAIKSPHFERRFHTLKREEWKQLQKTAQRLQITPTVLLTGCFAETLKTWAKNEHFALNLTLFNRLPLHEQINNILGDFTSLTLLEVDFKRENSFSKNLKQLQAQLLEDLDHKYYSGVEFQRTLSQHHGKSVTMPVVVTSTLGLAFEQSKNSTLSFPLHEDGQHYNISQTPQVTLDFQIIETPEGELSYNWDSVEGLFSKDLLDTMFIAFQRMLEELATDEKAWDKTKFDLLPESQIQLLETFNDTQQEFPSKLLHTPILEQISQRPEQTAVVCRHKSLSYAELGHRGVELAKKLKHSGVQPNQLVAVLMEKGWEQVVAVLGILQSGAAYLPIDASLPEERIHTLLKIGEVKEVVTINSIKENFAFAPGLTIWSVDDELDSEPTNLASMESMAPQQSMDDIAYVIFTSGSTGTPKGVVIDHRGANNTIQDINQRFQVSAEDRMLGLSNLSFDLSVYDVFGILGAGGTLVLPQPDESRDPQAWQNLLQKEKITLWNTVPVLMQMLVEYSEQQNHALDLRLILMSGDWIPTDLPERIHALSPQSPEIISLGGATEASIWSIAHPIEAVDPSWSSIPYGRPLANQEFYVLKPDMSVAPLGVAGDLYIGGIGLALGYWRDEEKTQNSFVVNPSNPQKRLYKTGDMGCMHPNGLIEFLGREDSQVKVQGHRIELGEIESRLREHEQILDAVVHVIEEGRSKRLVGYIVRDAIQDSADWSSSLPTFLGKTLPSYMVPNTFMSIEAVPLTGNGKVDRKALPLPEVSEDFMQDHVAPRGPVEVQLQAIWQELLGVEEANGIGIHDNFFELGGNSLMAVRMVGEIQNSLSKTIPLRSILNHPTIQEMASELDHNVQQQFALPTLEKNHEALDEPFPLNGIQQAYLLGRDSRFELGNVGTHSYTELPFKTLDASLFQNAWNKLIERHDMMRMVVLEGGSQKILSEVPEYEVKVLKLSMNADVAQSQLQEVRDEMSHRVFSGKEWPLFDIRLSQKSDGQSILHCSLDGLSMDASSVMLIIRQLSVLYDHPQHVFPELEINFRDYVLAEQKMRDMEIYRVSQTYWEQRLATFPAAPELPLALTPNQIGTPRFESRLGRLDKPKWEQLQKIAQKSHVTPTVFLLGCFSEVLKKWTKQAHFALNLTLFNRIPLHEQIDQLVGDFTSLTLLEVDFRESQHGFSEKLNMLQKQLWHDLEHKYFGGLEMLRALSKAQGQAVAMPIVVTSTLGLSWGEEESSSFLASIAEDEEIYSISQTPQVWLDFQIKENAKGELEYNWDSVEGLFSKDLLDAMFAAFQQMLEELATDEKAWDKTKFALLPESQVQLIETFNDTQQELPSMLLHTPILEQIRQRPEQTAVVCQHKSLSYAELGHRGFDLAKKLKHSGVQPNQLVAVLMEKGWEQVVAVLGILQSGAAYLPIDASLPEERIQTLLKIGEVKEVVTVNRVKENFAFAPDLTIWSVDDEAYQDNKDYALLESMPPEQSMDDIAYVIFTSGSTGIPKGVVIDHRGANNTIQDINQRFQVTSEDRMLGLSNLSFDLSVYDVFGILGAGGTLVLPQPNENRDPQAWQKLIQKEKVTLWNTVPVLMQMLVDYSEQQNHSLDLRLILMSGDWIPTDLPERIRALSPQNPEIISLGGATEASIWSIAHPIEDVDPNWSSIPYGKPLANQEFYVFKPDMSVAPLGVAGDLYIGGIGLALEYWRDEEKTRNSFVVDPSNPQKRLYKTGDMGCMHPSGLIEFLGREDSQVKVQGHRIELGEIESRLREHENVVDAVVQVVEEGRSKRLVGYIVGESCEKLHAFLAKTLPHYMIPSVFGTVEAIPLTANGKVDRKALPLFELSENAIQDHVEPRNPCEMQLQEVWQGLLDVEDTDGIGIHDNFFEVGGNSLLAVQMTGQLQKVFNKQISIQSIFESPSIAQLSAHLHTLDHLETNTIPLADRSQVIPMSFAQQRLWILDQLEDSSVTYNLSAVLQVEGTLDVEALEKSALQVIARHEPLRTIFKTIEGERVQVILPENQSGFSLIQHDLSKWSKEHQAQPIQELIETEQQTPFNLSKGPLLRMTLLKLSEGYILLFSMHHIVSDGRSLGIFMEELSHCYQAELGGKSHTLPELPIQYVDFSQLQHQHLPKEPKASKETKEAKESQKSQKSEKFQKQEDYWVKQLKDLPPFLELPTDHSRPAIQTFEGKSEKFVLPQEMVTGLKQLTQQHGGTLFMTLLGTFQVFLAKYSNMSDIAIGTTIANRNHPEVEGLIGFFVNTLVLRSQVDGEQSFEKFLRQVKRTTLEALENQDLPFNHLVDVLSPQRSLSHSPLFQVMFSWQDETLFHSDGSDLDFPGATLSVLPQESNISKFDLTLEMSESETGVSGRLEYNTDLFEHSTIQRMIGHFQVLLQSIVKMPQNPIQDLSLLSQTENQQWLVEWNNTASDFPKDRCIHELFEAQIEKTPDGIALIEGKQKLSYRELNARANQLAHCLVAQGVQPDSLVGLCIDHSAAMVIGLWGILKAGAAYVPLDPSFPKNRLEQMLEDAKLSCILTEQALVEQMPFDTQTVFCLDDSRFQNKLACFPTTNLDKGDLGLTSNHLAYMIYTSGSTGQPKGVMIEHQALVNRICWMDREYGLTADDVVLQKTSFSFDVSVWEFTWPMMTGAALVIAQTEGRKDPRYLTEQIVEHQVTTLHFVPVMLKAMLLAGQWAQCSSVRQVFCSGEALPYELQTQFFETGTQSELHNLYGPTEAAIDVSFWKCSPDSSLKTVPIGKPIQNTQLYVLDKQGKPVPAGVTGELHIGGIGLARGYKNRPELTQEKFIANPFSADPSSRLYKTGDLVSLRSGQLEFLGRVDHQVKLRGFRIELGEIEHNLRTFPAIQDVVVALKNRTTGSDNLCAYYISEQEQTVSELREHLLKNLPEFMVPSYFIPLDRFPSTSSGKMDLAALPLPKLDDLKLATTHVSPSNELERTIASVVQETLGIKTPGIHDNFFDLGGSSMDLVVAAQQLEKILSRPIPTITLFSFPSIHLLAVHLIETKDPSHLSSKRSDRNENFQTGRKRLQQVRRKKRA